MPSVRKQRLANQVKMAREKNYEAITYDVANRLKKVISQLLLLAGSGDEPTVLKQDILNIMSMLNIDMTMEVLDHALFYRAQRRLKALEDSEQKDREGSRLLEDKSSSAG